MRNSLFKLLALALAALMLLSATACGTTVDDSKDPAATTHGVSEDDTQDMRYVCELPDDLNYNDEEINIMYVKVAGRDIANRVSVKLVSTDMTGYRPQVLKSSEKVGLYTAMDLGMVWLERELKA